MQFIPIKTRVLHPPQDDIFAVLAESLKDLVEGDIVVISSKIVAIGEGRCVAKTEENKQSLALTFADLVIPREYWGLPVTVIHNAFLGAAGIDESNGNGYLVLLPEDPFTSASGIHAFLSVHFGLDKLGVIITDSQSLPFRYGATGVAIGWWGIEPLQDHRGRLDLFGRAIRAERSNLVDGLAAGATVVAGEVDECIPLVVIRAVPNVSYTSRNTKASLFAPFSDDKFRVLYERFLP